MDEQSTTHPGGDADALPPHRRERPRPQFPVPRSWVLAAEHHRRRRETGVEARIRDEAPSAKDAAAVLITLWQHPDRFPSLARGVRIERAFRRKHRTLEATTVAGVLISPVAIDPSIPAGASQTYVIASTVGAVGLCSWMLIGLTWSSLALMKMTTRRELPGTYDLVRAWTDADATDPAMTDQLLSLTTDYVQLLDNPGPVQPVRAAQIARGQLRRLALVSRKFAAATSAADAAASSGDDSTALVPAALAADLRAEFTVQAQTAAAAIDELRVSTAIAITKSKMRTLALPEPSTVGKGQC